MKVLLAILAVVVAVIVAWQMNFFEPAAAKAYRAHTERVMEGSGYSDDLVSPAKWSVDIENCSDHMHFSRLAIFDHRPVQCSLYI